MSFSSFYSHGKLLLTGEYFVLDGAQSLAIPTKKGQKMSIKTEQNSKKNLLRWTALTHENEIWFDTQINYKSWEVLDKTSNEFSQTLLSVLVESNKLTDFFLSHQGVITIQTHLEFPNDWGLGSSSSFINNIAQWLSIDPFLLLKNTLGGSGYDIACANASGPMIYQRIHNVPQTIPTQFFPTFHEQLYFIHLNQKQKSTHAITQYKQKKLEPYLIDLISDLTNEILSCNTIESFGSILQEHEQIVSRHLDQPTAKSCLFADYPHAIKSLGAWGGDFVWALIVEKKELSYFQKKGFNTIVPYATMVL